MITTVQPHSNTTIFLRILHFSAAAWLMVAALGQWIFGYYILVFYGKSTFRGDLEKWNQVLPHGYIAGDWKGNLVVSIHVLLAAVLVIGGPLQILPVIRQAFPVFHRLLGRVYVVTATVVSCAGLVMIWTRGGVGDQIQKISISFQAIYIIVFAFLTIKSAQSRQFDVHRRWALRLYMVVNGVWFFRVGLMCWLLVNGGPVGFDPETFAGPFLTFLSLFIYAIPLSLISLEMYFRAQRNPQRIFSLFTSVAILVFTIVMAAGIFAATMAMWLPRLE
jgi:uncharacterized membrane protein